MFLLRLLFCGWLVLLLAPTAPAQRLSPLAKAPDWTRLEAYQETITREDFTALLDQVYAPGGAAKGMIEVTPTEAVIKTALTPPAEFRLRFAADAAAAKSPPHYWRAPGQLMPAAAPQPLAGLKIAIDAGHLGGAWAQMEERWFRSGNRGRWRRAR